MALKPSNRPALRSTALTSIALTGITITGITLTAVARHARAGSMSRRLLKSAKINRMRRFI
jgi:hypothetical protein